MPLYEYECQKCGHTEDLYCSVKDHGKRVPKCCRLSMSQVLSAAYVQSDIQPYKSMVTGEMIGSRSAHRSHLKQHGYEEIGTEKIKPRKHVDCPGLKDDLIRTYKQVTGKL